ncbi:MAG: hypothetical protein ACLP1X_20940 [Polyangiaceae bacterium]|jgi:hypothetical protein
MSTIRTQPGQSGGRRHASRAAFFSLTVASLVVACSSSGNDKGSGADASQAAQDDGGQGASSSGAMSSSGSGASSGGGTAGVDSGSDGTIASGRDAAGSCLGSSFLSALGKDRLIVGVSGSNTAEGAAPYDLRYVYLSGGLFSSSTPCTSCSSCAPSGSWWGCYNTPPGMYATYFLQGAAAATPPQIPMFTYYEILQTAQATITNFQEGTAEATQAATNTGIMTRYYNDWRFLLQTIGQAKAILHIEPDFWGYVRQAGDPTTLPAAVGSVNSTDCSSLPSTIAGMGQCMISMVRKYAPNALVGLQASAWNSAGNTSASTDVTVDARAVAAVLAACGQSKGDFVVVETSDRDAGYYQIVESKDTWWDPTDKTLPDYAQDLTWIKALTEALGVPALYWQTPLGNSSRTNTNNSYKDNRVDYFFGGSASQVESGAAVTVPSHWSELAAAHVAGVAFGAGAGGQTSPDTDGGNLAAKTKAYIASGGQSLCQ